jgi:hypothetical protein
MEGKITWLGNLQIKREDGRMASQYCPYMRGYFSHIKCNDNCPLFGEVDYTSQDITLSLCRKILVFESLEDKR